MSAFVDYKKYLRGNSRKRLKELAIFEIGGFGSSPYPIFDFLSERNAKKVIYRGINPDSYEYLWDRSMSLKEWQRTFSQRMIQNHSSLKEGIDKLVIPWDGMNIPYPFTENSFDEFHCHMLDSPIISLTSDYLATPERFVDEVNRLLRLEGRVYLTIQNNLFFRTGNRPAYIKESVAMMDQMISRLQTHHFTIDRLDYGSGSNSNIETYLQQQNYTFPVERVNYSSLRTFTRESTVDLLLIATKMLV